MENVPTAKRCCVSENADLFLENCGDVPGTNNYILKATEGMVKEEEDGNKNSLSIYIHGSDLLLNSEMVKSLEVT